MTKPLPFTKANIRRRIEAVKEAGLHVTGIAPDGTVLTGDVPSGKPPDNEPPPKMVRL
jgi:hypothetical protein